MSTTVAAIFAHPDDEVLGCGATLAKHAAAGDDVRILILATGLAARGSADRGELAELRKQAEAAAAVLGAASVTFAEFPDNQMDTVALLSVVQRVEAFLEETSPDLIYTHHGGDLNVDHRVTHQAVVTACRPLPGRKPLEIRACEVNSSTEWASRPLAPFEPTIFEPIADTLAKKREALACYTGELRDWPHPRSTDGVDALACWRGAQCGHEAAEAFQLVRKVAP